MFVDLKMKNFGLKFNFTPKLWARATGLLQKFLNRFSVKWHACQ